MRIWNKAEELHSLQRITRIVFSSTLAIMESVAGSYIPNRKLKEIWPRFAPKENVYTVVREFNMPKMNVFPVTMLNDPKRAICMFVKKDEIKKRQK